MIYVFASKGGAPTNPDWYYNLLAHPEVQVEFGDDTFSAVATPVVGPERDRIYAADAENFPGFAEYQKGTDRVIPVVELRRTAYFTLTPTDPGDPTRNAGQRPDRSPPSGRREVELDARDPPGRAGRCGLLPGRRGPGAAGGAPRPLGRRGRRRIGSARAGRARAVPGPPRGPPSPDRSAPWLGPDHGGGVRPHLQRAQVGQRAFRVGRRRYGPPDRRGAHRGGGRCHGLHGAARLERGRRSGPSRRCWPPRAWRPACSPTGSTATSTRTCTATS